jgi:hypothetical protein
MIYITNNKEVKKYYYQKVVVPDIIKKENTYTDIKDENLLSKLKEIGFKFSPLKFGEKISEIYYYDGYKFLRLYKRREIDWKEYWNKGVL